jgi:hypothetical protein
MCSRAITFGAASMHAVKQIGSLGSEAKGPMIEGVQFSSTIALSSAFLGRRHFISVIWHFEGLSPEPYIPNPLKTGSIVGISKLELKLDDKAQGGKNTIAFCNGSTLIAIASTSKIARSVIILFPHLQFE